MLPPVTYQGGKQRLAAEIIKKMAVPPDYTFYDFCCGSGAISLALVESGHDPKRIVMVDQGPWGLFWQAIGNGAFDPIRFKEWCTFLPFDPKDIKRRIEVLHKQTPPSADIPYIFLLLQAAAIGGKAVSLENGRWKRGAGYRDYWLPTATSSRRSHVNPMMPMPDTICERVSEIAVRMRGVRGFCVDAATVDVTDANSVVYIDPQYEGTTGYPYSIRAVDVAKKVRCVAWVSEGKKLSDDAVCLSTG